MDTIKISRREYKQLKEFYPAKIIHSSPQNDRFKVLEDKGLVEPVHKGAKYNKNIITQVISYRLTNKGTITYELYREEHRNIRNASIRSWIAIIISLIALVISSLNFLFTWFPIINK